MLGGSFLTNKHVLLKCLKTGERMNLYEDSFSVEYDKENKIVYLRHKDLSEGASVVSYKIDELNDYAVLPYFIQGAIEGYERKDLPF
jgi:hypothetical protein